MAIDTLQKWALIAEVTGGFAIIISLIFVGIQFRENARATRSAMATKGNGMSSVWYTEMGNNPHTSNLFNGFLADFDSLEQDEKFQMVMYLHAGLLSFQNSFYLAEEDSLDPRKQNTVVESVIAIKGTPGRAYFWDNRRHFFFSEFQAFIGQLTKRKREASQS